MLHAALSSLLFLVEPSMADAPAMWVVRDADSTMYLYGTFHMLKPGQTWGSAAAVAALDEATEVWTEVEMGGENGAKMMAQMGGACLDLDGGLVKSLKGKERRRLEELGAPLGMTLEVVDHLRPWCAVATLTVGAAMAEGYDPAAGVDMKIDATARAAGKTVRGLETIEDQIRVLSGGTEAEQLAAFRFALTTADGWATDLNRAAEAWGKGDIAALEVDVNGAIKAQSEAAYDALLTQRNAAWTKTLVGELGGSGVDFVAVGAGHLIGPDSVVAMLTKAGFTVERVAQ